MVCCALEEVGSCVCALKDGDGAGEGVFGLGVIVVGFVGGGEVCEGDGGLCVGVGEARA